MTEEEVKTYYEKLGAKLARRRKVEGLTLKDVSAKISPPDKYINPQRISKWETGEVRILLPHLVQLATLYNTPITYFLEHTDAV